MQMTIDISCLAGFVRIGSDLVARAAMQCLEQAVVSTAIEYGSAAMERVSTRATASAKLPFAERLTCNAPVQR